MALELNGTTGVSLVQDGVVQTADLADEAVTAAKLDLPRWHVTLVTDMTGLADTAITLVEFDTASIDTESGFSTSTHHYTIPQTGTYIMYSQVVSKAASTSSFRDSATRIEKSIDSGSNWTDICQSGNRYSGNDAHGDSVNTHFMVSVNQGDVIRVRHYVNTTNGSGYTIGHDARLLSGAFSDAPGTGTFFGGYRIA